MDSKNSVSYAGSRAVIQKPKPGPCFFGAFFLVFEVGIPVETGFKEVHIPRGIFQF